MTPKEKARDLVNKYVKFTNYWDYYNDCLRDTFLVIKEAKECALIAVDEILKLELNEGYDHEFWKEVKQEIINIS